MPDRYNRVGSNMAKPIDKGTNCLHRSLPPCPLGTEHKPLSPKAFPSAKWPKFETLWSEHPHVKGNGPLLDENDYPDQCAVNLYASLKASGFDTSAFHGRLSWQKDKPKYAIAAQELADWFTSKVGSPEIYTGSEVFEKVSGRTGIIFFRHYWGLGNQGNHIDLWNGSRLTAKTSWIRIHFDVSWRGIWTDYRGAKAVWFWPVT